MLVLEARDRVGGRTVNASIGAGQGRRDGRAVGRARPRTGCSRWPRELGVETFPTYHEGRNLLELRGKLRRYKGTIPRLAPHVLLDIDRARRRLRRAAAPGAGRRAVEGAEGG